MMSLTTLRNKCYFKILVALFAFVVVALVFRYRSRSHLHIPLATYQHECAEWFHDSFEDNLKVVANYPTDAANEFLTKIGGNLDSPKEIRTFPVFLTASNEYYFPSSKELLKNIHERLIPVYKDFRIIYYDLGLSSKQRQELQQFKVEVRDFPFEDFPSHVKDLRSYAWKPIIIQKTLIEFGAVWYVDSSVRFVTDNLEPALEYAKQNGVLFYTNQRKHLVSIHTNKKTFEYFQEDVCKYRHFTECEAGFGLYIWQNITQIFVRAWVSCALTEGCIAPEGSVIGCPEDVFEDGICHRYDQSAFSIIARRLFHKRNKYPYLERPLEIYVLSKGGNVYRKYQY